MPAGEMFEVNGTRLYVEDAGRGDPLVLIHGFSLDTRMWDDQLEPFAERYRVVRYDLRGFGRSDLPTDVHYRHADDLRALLDALEIERAHVLGLSLGGGIALDFALEHAAALRSLILVDAIAPGFDPPGFREMVGSIWSLARGEGLETVREAWLATELFAPAMQIPTAAARLRQMVEEFSGYGWYGRDPGTWAEPLAATRLGQISAPALVVVGDRDAEPFRAISAMLHERIPVARLVTLPGSGHMSNMEVPAAFNDAVLDFLSATG